MENYKLEIINPSFPRGSKFYKVKVGLEKECEKLFCLDMYNAGKYLKKSGKASTDTLNVASIKYWASNIELVGKVVEFPKFKVKGYNIFLGIAFDVRLNHKHLSKNYQNVQRIPSLGGMPYTEGMIIQWDNTRKGFILHDTPYEGELVKVPKSGISIAITNILKDVVAEAGIFELLGLDYYVTSTQAYNDSTTSEEFKEAFEGYLVDAATDDQIVEIALTTGAYITRYSSSQQRKVSDGKYYKLIRKEGSKPKISTITRTSLMYKYGGYKLPDNYEEWFDG